MKNREKKTHINHQTSNLNTQERETYKSIQAISDNIKFYIFAHTIAHTEIGYRK